MVLHTMDRNFFKTNEIDAFNSALWTERFLGDGEFQLNVPASPEMKAALPKGQLMMCEGSIQPMILEERTIKDGELEATGISLTKWLNNRIIRTTYAGATKVWLLSGYVPGLALQQIVGNFCMPSQYVGLGGGASSLMGVATPISALFAVPGLTLGAADTSGSAVEFSVPFGGVYDALRQIAEPYGIGMRIDLTGVFSDHFVLQFITFKGVDRTSDQNTNPLVRFSSDMESFTNIQDLESITNYKNMVMATAPQAGFLAYIPYEVSEPLPSGPSFDLRVEMYFDEETTVDDVGGDIGRIDNVLRQKARNELADKKMVHLVDGEVVQTGQFIYGRDYFLGDTVEVVGNTGILQQAKITEYIRSQDSAGERAYPTLDMV